MSNIIKKHFSEPPELREEFKNLIYVGHGNLYVHEDGFLFTYGTDTFNEKCGCFKCRSVPRPYMQWLLSNTGREVKYLDAAHRIDTTDKTWVFFESIIDGF